MCACGHLRMDHGKMGCLVRFPLNTKSPIYCECLEFQPEERDEEEDELERDERLYEEHMLAKLDEQREGGR